MVFLHSSERELGMARAGLKALLLPKRRIEFDQPRSTQRQTPEISEAKKATAAIVTFWTFREGRSKRQLQWVA